VAENQPDIVKQNRMTSELSDFAARLRASIWFEGRVAQGPDSFPSIKDLDSDKSSFRNDAVFNSLALELFALQFTHNLAYRKICEARRVSPQSVSHWSQIPAVPTAAFKELELTCLPPAQRTQVFHSSGTIEQRPSRHFQNTESLAVYEASLLVWFRAHIPNGGKLLLLTPPPAQAPHSSLVHMFATVRREFSAPETTFVGAIRSNGSWALNFDTARRSLRDACEVREPVLLLGTAFSFVHLLDFLTDQDLRFQLPPGSRVMETGGYKGRSRSLPKAELYACITERLGIPRSQIICEYGMCELSSQAYEIVLQLTGAENSATGSFPGKSESRCHSVGEAGTNGRPESQTSPCSLVGPRNRDFNSNGGAKAVRPTDPVSTTRHFCFPAWARVRIISPETGREVVDGETGLIRVFDLANVFSVMAVQTGDLGGRRGVGFELIGRAELAEPRGCSLMSV
jgi:hypothetical protein